MQGPSSGSASRPKSWKGPGSWGSIALLVRSLVTLSMGLVWVLVAAPTPAFALPTVAVQPVAVQTAGTGEAGTGANVREQVARIVRSKGFRVKMNMPQASGTGQYMTWAREHALTAFVVTELEVWGKGKYQKATFLVWNGIDGAVVGRWSVAAPTKKMWKAIAKSFWKRLGPALSQAQAPPGEEPVGPAPPMRIDASSAYDDAVVSDGSFRRPR
jgi:hypothetical protein